MSNQWDETRPDQVRPDQAKKQRFYGWRERLGEGKRRITLSLHLSTLPSPKHKHPSSALHPPQQQNNWDQGEIKMRQTFIIEFRPQNSLEPGGIVLLLYSGKSIAISLHTFAMSSEFVNVWSRILQEKLLPQRLIFGKFQFLVWKYRYYGIITISFLSLFLAACFFLTSMVASRNWVWPSFKNFVYFLISSVRMNLYQYFNPL